MPSNEYSAFRRTDNSAKLTTGRTDRIVVSQNDIEIYCSGQRSKIRAIQNSICEKADEILQSYVGIDSARVENARQYGNTAFQ